MKKLVIKIPNYIRRVKLSDKRRTYYTQLYKDGLMNRKSITSKGKRIASKYLNPFELDEVNRKGYADPCDLKSGYTILAMSGTKTYLFTKVPMLYETAIDKCYEKFTEKQMKVLKLYVYDIDAKSRLVTNKMTAGTPKYEIISGQKIYSSDYPGVVRAKIMTEIKLSFLPYVKDIDVIDFYPIKARLIVHDTIKNVFDKSNNDWDIGSRGQPYLKGMLDLLVTSTVAREHEMNFQFLPKLIEDHRLIVTGEYIDFNPIHPDEEPYLEFSFEEDNNWYRNNYLAYLNK